MSRALLLVGVLVAPFLMGQNLGEVPIGTGTTQPTAMGGTDTTCLGCQSFGSSGCPSFAATPLFDFDADAETGYSDSDPVSTFTDQGSNGVDLTQGVGSAQATFESPCTGLAGHDCYSFDGGDFGSELEATFGSYAQSNLICVVHRSTTDTGNPRMVAGITSRNDLFVSTVGGLYAIYGGTQAITSVPHSTGTWSVACATFNGASSSITAAGSSETGLSAGTDNLAGLAVGVSHSRASAFFTGRLARVVGWDSGGTEADAVSVLNCVYGL